MLSNVTESKDQLAYSVEQLEEVTSLSKAFWRKEIRSGKLKARLVGRRVLVLKGDLTAYLETQPIWEPLANR